MKKILAGAAVLMSFNAFAGGNIEAGKAAVQKFNCAACHGQDFNSPVDPSYPKLAGQHEDYLAHALIAYQRGADGANGRGNAIMGSQAKPLSHQNIQDIAAYLHSLPGSLVLRK
ncbi:MAG TPA: cytochrome c [Noviherbaspirillum sp.]|uniref:c-type cytochrome n=1 Tax=Noviherbaspirillum sp. TaxID=1926288 RepID=UPI002B4753F3|nr:cytochrome c [Noviherbaspirillum sp.]HJV86710.1 cytochrome c [Noviherbaspirillum sp.]